MRAPLGLALVSAALLGGCAGQDPAADGGGPVPAPSTLVTVEPGVLTACVAPTPALAEASADGWEGFDVAVLEGLAEQLDLELALVEAVFDELVSGVALNGGRCDVAAAGIVDDDALDAVARPSTSYRSVQRLLVAMEGAAVEPSEVTGTVAVEDGSEAIDAAGALAAAELLTLPSRADLRRALLEGVADAALVTVMTHAELEEEMGADLAVIARLPSGVESVLLLPLGAGDDLLEAVDGAIGALREDGALEALRAEWLLD